MGVMEGVSVIVGVYVTVGVGVEVGVAVAVGVSVGVEEEVGVGVSGVDDTVGLPTARRLHAVRAVNPPMSSQS